MRAKAVFFDAGGTLFQPHPSVGQIYSETAHRYGLTVDPNDIETLFHSTWQRRDGLASLAARSGEKEEKKWWREVVWEVFSQFGRIENFDAFFEELYNQFASPEAWRLFSDALPVLQELKRRGKIVGIVSNWDSRLFGLCERLGLGPYLDFILASAVVGVAKPHPKIFQEALRRARVPPEEALHVGDSVEDDVLGARGAGIQAIFLDRKGGRPCQAPTISALQFLCGMFEN
jgi:putative hydrolase of the HAD superfamily